MMAYELDIPTQKGWDMQTFDNLVDNVCNAKQTYLSNDVREFNQHEKHFFLLTIFLLVTNTFNVRTKARILTSNVLDTTSNIIHPYRSY